MLGSWLHIYAIMWAGETLIKEKGKLYDWFVGAGMWAYISHYLFIVISSQYIVRRLEMSYEAAFATNFLFTELSVFMTYALIKFICRKIGIKPVV